VHEGHDGGERHHRYEEEANKIIVKIPVNAQPTPSNTSQATWYKTDCSA